jgi:VIT1/CCC1 family predicted Fe2+/Mn2+ transporter
LYLFWLGLPILMKAPADKAATYAIVVLVACIVVYAVIGMIGARAMY